MILLEYIKIFIFSIVAFAIVSFLVYLSLLFNKKNNYFNSNKPVECGSHSFGSGRNRVEVNFFIVAVLFVIFEVELVIIVPWLYFYKLSNMWGSDLYMVLFLLQLALGLVFEYTRKVINFKK